MDTKEETMKVDFVMPLQYSAVVSLRDWLIVMCHSFTLLLA